MSKQAVRDYWQGSQSLKSKRRRFRHFRELSHMPRNDIGKSQWGGGSEQLIDLMDGVAADVFSKGSTSPSPPSRDFPYFNLLNLILQQDDCFNRLNRRVLCCWLVQNGFRHAFSI